MRVHASPGNINTEMVNTVWSQHPAYPLSPVSLVPRVRPGVLDVR